MQDFTLRERVEIGKALEGELSKRVGVNQHTKEGRENLPHPPEGRTRDLAAKAAGFGNGKTYEQAKVVGKPNMTPLRHIPAQPRGLASGRQSVAGIAPLGAGDGISVRRSLAWTAIQT